jgi:hypothetical protein
MALMPDTETRSRSTSTPKCGSPRPSRSCGALSWKTSARGGRIASATSRGSPWNRGSAAASWRSGTADRPSTPLVTHMVTGARLTISGPMGMRGARQYVKTYELAADGDGTLVTTTASMLGDIDDELRESYTTGGAQLLQALKAHAESKVG